MVTREAFEEFDEYYDEAKARIDDRLVEIIGEQEEFLLMRRLLEHSVKGGKRVRPVMALLVSDVFDSPYERAINHAVIVELVHAASLVADDLADDDLERRGSPTIWRLLDKLPFGRRGRKYVTGATIMAENGMMAIALDLIEDPDVATVFAHGVRQLVDGFFLEGTSMFGGYVSGGYDRYVEVCKAKTGGLFAMSTWVPPTYVDAPQNQTDAARKYGEATGILYQVADDIVDGDIPDAVDDPDRELEKWYDIAVSHSKILPDDDRSHLLPVAPAYMVYRMLDQGDKLDDVDVSFLPSDEDGVVDAHA